MKNSIIIIYSLMLLISILMAVTLIGPLDNMFDWIQPIAPMIVITGFFTFLVATSLFVYGLINIFKKK